MPRDQNRIRPAYVDTGNLYVPATSAMYFLMDNTTGSAPISETDPGVISYLQVRTTPMTPAEVVDSLGNICNTVACGDGHLDLGEACDDGNVVNGDGCSARCAIELVPDGGMTDGGPIDGGPPADASARADASIAPLTKEGGCGCSTVGSKLHFGGAALASMALLGLVAARRARRKRA